MLFSLTHFQVPTVVDNYEYSKVTRTLCPFTNYEKEEAVVDETRRLTASASEHYCSQRPPVKPLLKKVSKYDNKFKQAGDKKAGGKEDFRANLKIVKKDVMESIANVAKKKEGKSEWSKKNKEAKTEEAAAASEPAAEAPTTKFQSKMPSPDSRRPNSPCPNSVINSSNSPTTDTSTPRSTRSTTDSSTPASKFALQLVVSVFKKLFSVTDRVEGYQHAILNVNKNLGVQHTGPCFWILSPQLCIPN